MSQTKRNSDDAAGETDSKKGRYVDELADIPTAAEIRERRVAQTAKRVIAHKSAIEILKRGINSMSNRDMKKTISVYAECTHINHHHTGITMNLFDGTHTDFWREVVTHLKEYGYLVTIKHKQEAKPLTDEWLNAIGPQTHMYIDLPSDE